MSRTTTTALALTLALSIPAAAAVAHHTPGHQGGPSQPAAGPLTLAAAPGTITFGGSTKLSGKLGGGQAGGVAVDIEAKSAPFTSGFTKVATVTTSANGDYSTTVKPGIITRYRATAKTTPSIASGEVRVGVRLRVGLLVSDPTPRRGRNVVFSGRVYPAHDGATVSIRKRTSTGSYVTVARTTLLDDGDARSRYRKAVRIRSSGVYQVRASSSDGDHLAGVSRARTITVHS